LKNRPALGEIAIQQLLDDNLLKFNFFLTDVRGRNVRSYMKIPIPSSNDPGYEIFVKNLTKHDIDIDDYRTVYEKSSIPSNNNLSILTLGIFESNALFITEYGKYKRQMYAIVQQHIQNHNIQETEDGNFIVTNKSVFLHQFHEIENLVPSSRQEKVRDKSQSLKLITQNLPKQTTESQVSLENTTTMRRSIVCSTDEKEREVQGHPLREISINQQHLATKSTDGNRFSTYQYLHLLLLLRNIYR
jgi:hypothetical protein